MELPTADADPTGAVPVDCASQAVAHATAAAGGLGKLATASAALVVVPAGQTILRSAAAECFTGEMDPASACERNFPDVVRGPAAPVDVRRIERHRIDEALM